MNKSKHRFWGNWMLNKTPPPSLEYKEKGRLFYQVTLNRIYNQSQLIEWIHQIGGRYSTLDFVRACLELQREGILDTPLEWEWEVVDMDSVKINPEDTGFDAKNPAFLKPNFMVSFVLRLLEICSERKYELAEKNYGLLNFIWRKYPLIHGPKINSITKQIFQSLRHDRHSRDTLRKLFPDNKRPEVMKAINILIDLRIVKEEKRLTLNKNYNRQCDFVYLSELFER